MEERRRSLAKPIKATIGEGEVIRALFTMKAPNWFSFLSLSTCVEYRLLD